MQIGMIGLGRMGAGMATKLTRGNIHVVGYDASAEAVDALANEAGFDAAYSLDLLLNALQLPRKIWVMLPAGRATDHVLAELRLKLAPGDLVVNGGNSFYKETVVVAESFRDVGVHFVDAGVSGGVHGEAGGYCLMVGGEAAAIQRLERIFGVLAPGPNQWLHTGPSGAGHFVKMIHNGIEYGMMQAYAEGFSLLAGKREFDFDIAAIAENWRHGSVVRSWLLDITVNFLKADQDLVGVVPRVPDSGEGRWTALEGIEQGIPTPVMSLALMSRFASQGRGGYQAQLLSMMRKEFGGHAAAGEEEE